MSEQVKFLYRKKIDLTPKIKDPTLSYFVSPVSSHLKPVLSYLKIDEKLLLISTLIRWLSSTDNKFRFYRISKSRFMKKLKNNPEAWAGVTGKWGQELLAKLNPVN